MAQVLKISRARIALIHDVIMAALSFPLALYLRVGSDFDYFADQFLLEGVLIFTAVAGLVFSFSGMYRGIWRYASTNDLVAILKSVSLSIVIYVPLLFLLTRLEDVPRSLPVIHWFILICMLGGPRFLYRIFKDRRLDLMLDKTESSRTPVLLIGAGDEAELFIREQARDRNAPYRVVGIIDEKGKRVGREIRGVPVLGSLEDIETVVARKVKIKPQRIILTKERYRGVDVRSLLPLAEKLGISLARLPRLAELKDSVEDRTEVKPIAVEDILGRPQTLLDREGMRNLVAGKRVLVTGAGGTIGSELVRQIAAFGPKRLILIENAEYHLYQIDMELANSFASVDRVAVLGDVRDAVRLQDVFRREQPELVFHAAAYKHVPMVESNPNEGILTNVVGTRNVAQACRDAGVQMMVQISTDKAVDPSSVMGATKRLAESYCQALDLTRQPAVDTRFVVVRFGNVLGSTGSVVPLFQKQIAAGGPLTVTHPDMTRYFMTVREAVELVLQASVLGTADDAASGKIFVLDMGEPVKIVELARQMIRLAGLVPDEDIEINFTGLRDGEKLSEVLLHEGEQKLPTACDGLTLAAPRTADVGVLDRVIGELEDAARARKGKQALSLLQRAVPEFQSTTTERTAASL